MGTNCGKHKCKGNHDCGSCNETKHSRWKVDFVEDYIFKCSNCGYETDMTAIGFKYCPNCGAKMELEEQDNERTD